jgi:pimeloyl-ACP methyl ester carboxylesterase
MKKSWMLFLVGALLATVSLAVSARAQNNLVYAVEFNQSNNRFGTIDLWNGNFTQISSIGSMLINDIAYCPTNGILYGIYNTTALVTFNQTNGAITTIANLSVSGIESLAFRPSDGVLFGCTQSGLYTINPTNGNATSVGSFGSPYNLNNQGQNIRFAQDDNLYISNTSMNTDIYRISTTNGAATWMGEAVGYPYLTLENASSNMYGVFVNLGSAANGSPELVTLDLSSFVVGGTNANGTTHQITINLVGPGTNFPANFNFSGNVPQAVTNLTVPVSATGPSNQTTVVGSNVVFSTVASGTGPYNYAWSKNGAAISGQINSSLTLNNVTTDDVATYSVIVGGAIGTVTNSATLTVTKASGSITLGSLSQTYSGSAEPATATTTPAGLTVNFTYNGLATIPTSTGSYTVVGTINDANYQGSATDTLVINAATLTYTANAVSMTYGSAVPGLSGSVSGFVGTDNQGNATTGTLTFTPAATSTSGVGSYAINGAGLTANNGNYTFVQAAGNATALTISALPVNLTGTRSYDGTTAVAAGILSVANKVGSDNVTVASGNGTLAGANVGSETITSFGTLSLSGASAGNYTLAGASGSVNITVSALALTVTNLLALDNVYDGTTNATLDATNAGLAGVLNGDDVTLVTSNAVAYFADKNVGTNKPVTVTGLALGGAAAANYTLMDPTNVTADITVAELTVDGVTAASKVYDGTTNAQLNGTATLNGEVSGDDVSLVTDSVSAAFAGPNVGTGISVTVSGYDLTGADAGNYTLTQPTGLTADITAATLTITATANTKIYDGNTSAAAVPTVSGLQGSDTVTGLAETYDTQNAGTGKTLSVSSYTVNDGNSGSNYTVNTVASAAGLIEQAIGSVTLGSLSQTYDGSAKAVTATTTPSGLAVTFTYNGSATVPTAAGTYTVVGTINDANYTGSATGTLMIDKASATISLGSLSQTYSGSAEPATATTTPAGLTVNFTYNGLATIPTSTGSYTVVGTINDANYQGSATDTLVINAATLTYTANVASMTYGSAVPGLSGSVSGFVGTDNQGNATTGTLTFTPAATSTSGVGSYAINGAGLTANNGNYTFVQAAGNATALTISALPVNLTGTRSYDGTTAVAAGILSVANKVGSDNVTVASGNGTLAGANVGSETITSFGTLSLSGASAGNYTLAGASGSVNITVSALALTVTNLLALDNVYDGTTNATLDATNAGLAGVLNGDDVTLVTSNAVAYFADKNVGTNKPVTVTGLALGGAAAANYTLMDPTNVTADITVAELTVDGVTAASKVYDGTTNAQLNGTATLNGEVSGDDVSLVTDSVSAAFAGPNVGTGISVTVSGYDLTGADAGNYTLTQPTGLTADITAATLTITATANTKIYDGNTSAAAVPTVSGLQGSDTVTGLAETYDTQNAGTGKTLSVSSYTVNDGNSGNNYTVSTIASTTGVINAATLTITAAANTKTYDSSTSAAATPTISGLQGSDSVTGLAETYDTKNVGTGKTLSVSAFTVNDGNNGNNYTVSTVASTAGVINAATLTITAAANTKTYDSSTSAAATPTISGLQGSDSVTGLAETYDTKNVGTSKTLSVSAFTVNDGNSGNNYTVNTVASTAGVINQAALTINAVPNTKTYDGTISAAAIPTVSGLQGFDSVSGLAETYDTKDAGIDKTLSVSAYTINDGNNGNNYTVGNTNNFVNSAGVITPATLTVTADNKTKIYGQANPSLTASYNGFVNGESVSVLSSPAVLSTTATTTSGAGKYPITVSGAADADYTIQYVNGTLQVISAPQLAGANINVNGINQFVVNCPTIAGQTYQLEYTTNLVAPNWTSLGTPFAGTDGIVAVTNSMSATPQCFFRVEVLEEQ